VTVLGVFIPVDRLPQLSAVNSVVVGVDFSSLVEIESSCVLMVLKSISSRVDN